MRLIGLSYPVVALEEPIVANRAASWALHWRSFRDLNTLDQCEMQYTP